MVEPHHQNQLEWQEKGMEYLRYEYPLSPSDIVIDLGSYQGEWAEAINNRYGCHVVCVEPTPYINRLQSNGRFTIINKAGWLCEGVRRFGGAYYYTSAHEPVHTFGYNDYECFDLNLLLERYDQIGLLKINIEGDEYPVLNHIMPHMRRIKFLQVQFHIVNQDSESDWMNIVKQLKTTHDVMWCKKFVWESWKLK
jgi:FkbM family methyltransferase